VRTFIRRTIIFDLTIYFITYHLALVIKLFTVKCKYETKITIPTVIQVRRGPKYHIFTVSVHIQMFSHYKQTNNRTNKKILQRILYVLWEFLDCEMGNKVGVLALGMGLNTGPK